MKEIYEGSVLVMSADGSTSVGVDCIEAGPSPDHPGHVRIQLGDRVTREVVAWLDLTPDRAQELADHITALAERRP